MFTLKTFLLNEAGEKKTQTKTTDWSSIFQNLNAQGLGADQNLPTPAGPESTPEPKAAPKQEQPKQSAFRRATADRTRDRASNVNVSPEMADKFSSMDLNAPDTISDDEAMRNASMGTDDHQALPNPHKQDNMPALMSKAVANTGVDPEWHMVKHLPGYLQSGIRNIGRAVFAPFTKTPIENIQVLANVNDSGPNDQHELDAVLTYLQRSGERMPDMEMEFQERIEGYKAQLRIFTAMGHTFITVKDFAGKYIYSWPTADGDLEGVRPRDQVGVSRPRLR